MNPDKPKTGIDWTSVHAQMARAEQALQREFEPDEAVRDAVLQARARALAQVPAAEGVEGEQMELVEFRLAHEHYGLETRLVREVYPLRELGLLPCVPPFVLGIINLRGQIVSVIDLKRFFGLPLQGLPDMNKVILLEDGAMRFGLLADQIIGVRSVALADLQPSLPTLNGVRAEYLRGVAPDRLVVLDALKLIHDPALLVDEEVPS
ncbi:purine-binding chemotaxis protein CheW [Chitinimonas arctica]|uniref:Purine-binding chemotaxis protein CheW n=1 Tax=Chitinimonas arctica TaxID=2594795 RepID=A0A516SEL4_9NEIS|nr:chemotaxis protein CheW [Chitinimonas arctica]QDQ26573.1 purine-binding chemotaxis protein CheW [Chitinimonas arctica]